MPLGRDARLGHKLADMDRLAPTCLAGFVISLHACAPEQVAPAGGPERAGQTLAYPFAPASMRIHPLTHLDVDAQNRPIIVVHVETRDRWGEPCKSVGDIIVQLNRPALGANSGLEREDATWEVDLSDLDQNARYYDPATRTYRLQLSTPPKWLLDQTGNSGANRARITATLTTRGVAGDQVVFDDSYVLQY